VTEDELLVVSRMIKTAGLIKVWNGQRWIDLRDHMMNVITSYQSLAIELNELKTFTDELTKENEELKRLLFSAE
jgi:hypothetical protein